MSDKLTPTEDHQWTTLTSELKNKNSPLLHYIRQEFPNTIALRREFDARSGPLLVAGGDAPANTIGTAFDVLTMLVLDETHKPTRFPPSSRWTKKHALVGEYLTEIAVGAMQPAFKNPDVFYWSVWGLGLLTEVHRAFLPGAPINKIVATQAPVKETLLAVASLMPEDAIDQLLELREVADEHFLPYLPRPLDLNPEFFAAKTCAADADVLAGGTLIDIKVQLGALDKATGTRTDALQSSSVQQLIGYALFDTYNANSIERIGIYSARYGNLTTWPLHEALEKLAGKRVNLGFQREQVLDGMQYGFLLD
jgi:hypothetical protein